MTGFIRYNFFLASIILLMGLFYVQKADAATLANISDMVTTSRPSAAVPIAGNQAAAAGQVTVVDNGSIFLASDSGVFWPDTGETLNTINVASMSATGVPAAGQRIVYFTNTAANTHHAGDPLTAAITATHTIKFTTNTTVPGSGHIILTFPGTGANTASPSATGFSFNNLATSNPADVLFNNTTCASVAVTGSNTINCTLNASGIAANTVVTVLIGCTAQSSGTCTTFAPRFINPTKTAAAGTADTWKITVQTTDSNSIILDSSKALVGTVEAVQVQATIEPYLLFTIAGLSTGTNITTQNASCTGGDVTNPGIGLNATATFVNLGSLANTAINISAQELTVTTNASAGYSITATSSGRFINPASGVYLADNIVNAANNGLTAIDTPAPTVFPVSGATAVFYGIHPCGADVNASTWANAATGFNSGAKYSNPWNVGTNGFYANIASFTGPSSARKTEVEYAATVGTTTPAGTYSNYFTYVATPTF